MPGLSRALEPAQGQGGVWTLLLLFLGAGSEHPPSKVPSRGLEGVLGGRGGEVAFPFKGALETYTNTCGQEVAAALSFCTTRFAASLEPCGVRMKDMN